MTGRRRRTRRRPAFLAIAVTALVVAVGCASWVGSDHKSESPAASSTPTASPTRAATSAPPAPAPPPEAGGCHRLDYATASRPTDPRPAVPCRRHHTSVTIAVGHVDQLVDGHLLAIDSRSVQHQLARTCPKKLASYVGGTREERRLSRFQAVWFGPSVHQADLGADWYRCDLVAVAGGHRLARLGRHLHGVLDRDGALDRYGTCGTTAPGTHGFDRVICARKHSWRAVRTIGLPKQAHYLGKRAGAAADRACKATAAGRAGGALKYTWSFEWPTREQWDSGQRFGYCWLPRG